MYLERFKISFAGEATQYPHGGIFGISLNNKVIKIPYQQNKLGSVFKGKTQFFDNVFTMRFYGVDAQV